MYCNSCGRSNPDSASFCSKCGALLAGSDDGAQVTEPAALHAVKPVPQPLGAGDRRTRPIDPEEYAAFVGPKNTTYYVDRFLAFDRGGGSVTWHWPAFFLPFYWLLYRRLYLPAILYLVLSCAFAMSLGFAGGVMGVDPAVFTVAMLVGVFIVPGMFANVIYFGHCRRTIQSQKLTSGSRDELMGRLTGAGGTGRGAAIAIGVFVVISLIGILAAIALPAYQDYTVRAKVSEGVLAARSASRLVEQSYLKNGQIPPDLLSAGYSPAPSRVVLSVELNPENAVVTATVMISDGKNGHIDLTPSQAESKSITWACSSTDIRPTWLPASCR